MAKEILVNLLLLILTCFSICQKTSSDILKDNIDLPPKELFKMYYSLFNKTYGLESDEGKERLENFKIKVERIRKHNSNLSSSYKMGFNQFSDLSPTEFRAKHLSSKKYTTSEILTAGDNVYDINGLYFTQKYIDLANIPHTNQWQVIDYSSKCGKVFRQGNCGCCYTFAMLNAIECNYNIQNNVLPTLSRQQIVDCSSISHGCHGGSPTLVGIYAKSVGLMFDSDYPYIEKESPSCRYDKSKANQYFSGIEVQPNPFRNTGRDNPYQHSYVIHQMLTKGVVVVGIDGNAIQDYEKGIVSLTDCYEDNHAVIIVGFGKDPVYGPYWLVKNQWHTTWGENGYGRFSVREDSNGNCFINNDSIRPII